jgi:hypothetical protein
MVNTTSCTKGHPRNLQVAQAPQGAPHHTSGPQRLPGLERTGTYLQTDADLFKPVWNCRSDFGRNDDLWTPDRIRRRNAQCGSRSADPTDRSGVYGGLCRRSFGGWRAREKGNLQNPSLESPDTRSPEMLPARFPSRIHQQGSHTRCPQQGRISSKLPQWGDAFARARLGATRLRQLAPSHSPG